MDGYSNPTDASGYSAYDVISPGHMQQPAFMKILSNTKKLSDVNAFPPSDGKSYLRIQRLSLGLKRKQFQFGMAADFSTVGRSDYISTNNLGGILRYEY